MWWKKKIKIISVEKYNEYESIKELFKNRKDVVVVCSRVEVKQV